MLQVEVLNVVHQGWGWSSVTNGLGFLQERFAEAYLFHWQLERKVSRSLAPAVVPLRPFCGVMGVAPAEAGEVRTGNMDVRELCRGSVLYLPVLNDGALFSAGEAHAAQGDGEVCINGIECPAGGHAALSSPQTAIARRSDPRIPPPKQGRQRGCLLGWSWNRRRMLSLPLERQLHE